MSLADGIRSMGEGYIRPPPTTAHPGLRTHIHTLFHTLLSDLEAACLYLEVNAYIRSLFPFDPTLLQSFQAP